QAEIVRLQEARLTALEARLDADLALGRHGELAGEIQQAVTANALREGLRFRWILALYRAGRQAEALQVYEDARQVLSGELGIDPSPDLQRLHQAILRQDPALATPERAPEPQDPPSGMRKSETHIDAMAQPAVPHAT